MIGVFAPSLLDIDFFVEEPNFELACCAGDIVKEGLIIKEYVEIVPGTGGFMINYSSNLMDRTIGYGYCQPGYGGITYYSFIKKSIYEL